jgi:hypothetical protein
MVTEGGYERIELHRAAHAREFGRALIAAADGFDRLTESPGKRSTLTRV